MKIYNMPQQSPEWFAIKFGKISASGMSKVLAGGAGKTRRAYMLKLAAEILTGQYVETYKSDAMERGNLLEPEARIEYERIYGVEVSQIGWAESGRIGCSPDGLVGEGLVEIKCPLPTTHIEYCLKAAGWTPPEYYAQMQGQMWVMERPWCDFVSYCPEINGKHFLCARVNRDDKYIENLSSECYEFLVELDEIVQTMTKIF